MRTTVLIFLASWVATLLPAGCAAPIPADLVLESLSSSIRFGDDNLVGLSRTEESGMLVEAGYTQVGELRVQNATSGATVVVGVEASAADNPTALSVQADVNIAGALNGANVDDLILFLKNSASSFYAKDTFSYGHVSTMCSDKWPGSLPLYCGHNPTTLETPNGRTGDDLCSRNAREAKTCAGLAHTYSTVAGSVGTHAPNDRSCTTIVGNAWPWATAGTSSLAAEWNSPSTYVVCCVV